MRMSLSNTTENFLFSTNLPIERKTLDDYLALDLPVVAWNDKCYSCLLYLSKFPERGSAFAQHHDAVRQSLKGDRK